MCVCVCEREREREKEREMETNTTVYRYKIWQSNIQRLYCYIRMIMSNVLFYFFINNLLGRCCWRP